MSVGAAALGMLGGAAAAGSQNRNQRRLMNMQYQNQRLLNQQGSDLQYDMWKKTNFPAQVAMMKEAGLNPALMYKGAGPGGTTGSQGGGSAASGSAAQVRMMDMSNLLVKAQIADTEAAARLKNVEADKKAGIDTEVLRAQTDKIRKEIGNISADTVKKVQETTNLKTLDEVNEFERQLKDLRKQRGDKGMLQGDALGNLLQAVNLDPVNNEADRDFIQAILIGMGVLRAGTDIGKIILSLKPKVPKG